VSCVDGRGRVRRYGRFLINNKYDGTRMLTPHQVAARLGFGPIPAGATLLHDCEIRLCCHYGTGHVRVGTQSENMRHAVAQGRAVGTRPGRVDVRGKVGASRAIQAALRDAADHSPAALAAVLAAVIADGDPMRDIYPLFDVVAYAAGPVAGPAHEWTALTGPTRRRAPSGTCVVPAALVVVQRSSSI
jgi:hypothetical protein